MLSFPCLVSGAYNNLPLGSVVLTVVVTSSQLNSSFALSQSGITSHTNALGMHCFSSHLNSLAAQAESSHKRAHQYH